MSKLRLLSVISICVLILLTVLGGCALSEEPENSIHMDNQEHTQNIGEAITHTHYPFLNVYDYVYTDSETGVQYIVLTNTNGGITMSPRFNADGTLCVKERTMENEEEMFKQVDDAVRVKITTTDLELFYNSNEDFKRYIDSYCTDHNITPKDAFQHKLIQEVYYYMK